MSQASDSHFRHILLLNLGILCISTSGVLGRYISLAPTQIIFWRSSLAFLCLFFWVALKRKSIFNQFQTDPIALVVSGFLLGLHWVTYFYALQWSSVAIGMLSLYTFPIITAFLEPLFGPEQFQIKHFILGIGLLFGIYLISPEIDWKNQQFLAVGMGVFSAVCFSFRNLLLKKRSQNTDGQTIMTTQVAIISIFLLPVALQSPITPVVSNGTALFFLALITTVIGHSLFLQSFQKFSITTASLISCLQPLYGIIMGAIWLQEYPQAKTLVGGGIILSAVGYEIYTLSKK